MKILCVGNSFSVNAFTHLHQAAQAQGEDVTCVALYIGGCSLERHWQNVLSGEAAYEYHLNGAFTGRKCGIVEVLQEDAWDVIATQQASHDSGWMDSYEPFLGNLVALFRRYAPNAKLCLHETWAYEICAAHGSFPRYNCDQYEMYDRLRHAYRTMARKHDLTLIPCGEVIQTLRSKAPFHVPSGGLSLCQDGFHLTQDYGCYALACTWLNTLCGLPAVNNTYRPEKDAPVDNALLDVIRQAADEVCMRVKCSHC